LPLAVRIPEDFLGLDLIPKLDNIVVFLLVSAILFFIAIFRFNALEILPIAHDLIVQNIKSGIVVLNTTGHVVEINPYARLLIGQNIEDAIGKPLETVLKDWPSLGSFLQLNERLENEISVTRNNRTSFLLVQVSPIRNKRDIFSGHVIVVLDITDRKQAEMELERLARTDALTGVTNRRQFFETAEKQFELAKRYSRQLAVMMLDVDYFKNINDRYGHRTGDQVLQFIAGACQRQVRSTDTFARYGGEEFICLLPEQSERGAHDLAERIRQMIEQAEVQFEAQSIRTTVSIGLAFIQDTSDLTLEKLIDHADQALYESKSAGRNRITNWHDV
jgi:diguanylate cyclase (GGDEF)-like protein/PAS domain S-box-containing protein